MQEEASTQRRTKCRRLTERRRAIGMTSDTSGEGPPFACTRPPHVFYEVTRGGEGGEGDRGKGTGGRDMVTR